MSHYEFPAINHLNEVLEAIEGRDEFVVKVDEEFGYTVVNYLVNFEDTFPPVTDRRTAILRECRGITFDTATGRVVARKFHKFFNLGERPETQVEAIDFNQPYVDFEKLDGSMLTPLMTRDGLRWCTKMGLTGVAKPVDEFTADKPEYHSFCAAMCANGNTPIFEWCSRQQRIVIDYAEERLVLLAVRENVSGRYLTPAEMEAITEVYGIPMARYQSGSGYDADYIQGVRDIKGEEGIVRRFANGHMIKVKGDEYSLLHKVLDQTKFEKDVIRLILKSELDDVLPRMADDMAEALKNFGKDLFAELAKTASNLHWEAVEHFDNTNGSKKLFAQHVMSSTEKSGPFAGLKFKAWDMLDQGEAALLEYLISHVIDHTSSAGRVDHARMLWNNLNWYDYIPRNGE